MPSFGNFGVASEVQYYFGFPRTIGFPGLQMDIDRVAENTAAKDATSQTRIAFLRALGGQYSAHEHLIPETLFRDGTLPPTDPNQPQAVSAVKAIAIAASQGQKIYTLNSANQAIHAGTISQLGIDSGVKQEIANALASGKEVTVHQGNINYAGFSGSGYIITDPQTGAGAFKISGGINGSGMSLQDFGQLLLTYLGGFLGIINQIAGGIVDAINTLWSVIDALWNCPNPLGQWLAGLTIAFFVVAVLSGIVLTIFLGAITSAVLVVIFTVALDAWLSAVKTSRCGA